MLGMLAFMENSETIENLHLVACVNRGLNLSPKSIFWQIGVFTKYRCFNASKWPQMPQKWVNTIPFGSGHTLGTLNHGLGSLFCCFITLFGAGGSLDPPGAPWCPLAPPWTLWCPNNPLGLSCKLGFLIYFNLFFEMYNKKWKFLNLVNLFWSNFIWNNWNEKESMEHAAPYVTATSPPPPSP